MNWQERAEKAEAELAKLREQDPYAWDCGGDLSKNKDHVFDGHAEYDDGGCAVYTSVCSKCGCTAINHDLHNA